MSSGTSSQAFDMTGGSGGDDDTLPYRPDFFHTIFLLASCYMVGLGWLGWRHVARRVAAGAGGATGPSVLVDRIFVVADIGRILNADIARQQIEGGLIYGIGLTLGSSSPYVAGLPTNTRLSQMDLPVLGNCPDIQVEFVSSDAPPFDPGELGVAVAAPAIANALASATGLRFRKLPLIAEEE